MIYQYFVIPIFIHKNQKFLIKNAIINKIWHILARLFMHILAILTKLHIFQFIHIKFCSLVITTVLALMCQLMGTARVSMRLHRQTVQQILHAPLVFFSSSNQQGKLLNRLSDVNTYILLQYFIKIVYFNKYCI